ncbi:MAG: hypothetical protein CNIPEHKO_03372 [Anaerolineales bacterium]|nr:hypothetical protein [Anaerolineales bacterium]
MHAFKKLFYAFLCASLLTAALGIQPAYAASIVVNTNADTVANDGACTLREAITNANADNQSGSTDCAAGAGADAITFAADYTITLVGSQLPAIASTITITGNGETNTILQANVAQNTATYRVLEVNATGNLTLASLTVRNGRCNGSCATAVPFSPDRFNGGGMYNAGTATLTNVTFSANSAGRLGIGSGGGMYNTGTATLTNVTFSANSAQDSGGGMYNTGTATLTNITFSANSTTTPNSSGGGMYNTGTATLTNVTFSANSADFYGGGMYNNNSNPTLTNVTFSANSAVLDGGGMYNSFSNPTLTNVTFSANSAVLDGGGMYNYFSSPTLTNVTFSANSAVNNGGGMYNRFSNPTLTNVTFSANSAAVGGGGMFNYFNSNPTLTNVTFSANSAVNNGGGMFNDNSSSPTLTNVIIANSTGGGDCYNNGGTLNAASANNLIEDAFNTCGLTDGSNGNIVGQDPNLGPLANNGGFTQTFALQAGSPAIDAGTNAGCPSDDQRGFLRPIGSTCDIGAYEYSSDTTFPTVITTSLVASYVNPGPNAFTVTFSENVADYAGNSNPNDVTNPVNYLLVENGADNAFNTASCAGGLLADDTQVTVIGVTYNALTFTSNVTLSGALPVGVYRLFVCGTTSIVDPSLNELNNGLSDYIFNFVVTTASTANASSLPSTGFAPNRITTLPVQPAELAYSAMGDLWLEIPALKVKSVIVGVPQASDKTWNVDWLGANTGWLNGTAFPTWNGNSVLTAHVTNANGLAGPFANLKELKYGDRIIVHLFGQQYIYEVRDTRLARPTSTSYAFKSLQDHSYLTLITCQDYNASDDSYTYRRIVRAVLVEVK